jgi:transcriptional regulator with XRE-family HTH domain
MMTNTTLAERLVSEREKREWSQETLARKAKIATSFIGALESGAQKTSGYLPEIAHALGVDCYWLKTGRGLARPLAIVGTDDPDDQLELMRRSLSNEAVHVASLLDDLPQEEKTTLMMRVIARYLANNGENKSADNNKILELMRKI